MFRIRLSEVKSRRSVEDPRLKMIREVVGTPSQAEIYFANQLMEEMRRRKEEKELRLACSSNEHATTSSLQ